MTDMPSVRQGVADLHEALRLAGADPSRFILDQLKALRKDVLFRLSYEAIAAETPATAAVFATCLIDEDPTSEAGRALKACVADHVAQLNEMSGFDFASVFVRSYLARAFNTIDVAAIKLRLYGDAFFEHYPEIRAGLEKIEGLWLVDPRNRSAPGEAHPSVYRELDHVSIWAHWSRQLTHPFYIDAGRGKPRLASGYVYDLRTMQNFVPPQGDLTALTRALLQEADLERTGSIPMNAFVEISMPPFTSLVFAEMSPGFVMVEALDADDRCLPIYLFPSMGQWSVPNTGFGPGKTVASFVEVAKVLAAMAAAALRDFWVVEDRDRVLGPPRIMRAPRSKHAERRVIYLPRIRYVGGQNFNEKAEKAADMKARAAHWRSEHYRKLPDGQKPTLRQAALAEAFGRAPPAGHTWIRGASVAGVEVERVYRSRSLAQLLFDVVPSKAQELAGLSWFAFEQH